VYSEVGEAADTFLCVSTERTEGNCKYLRMDKQLSNADSDWIGPMSNKKCCRYLCECVKLTSTERTEGNCRYLSMDRQLSNTDSDWIGSMSNQKMQF